MIFGMVKYVSKKIPIKIDMAVSRKNKIRVFYSKIMNLSLGKIYREDKMKMVTF